LPLTGVGLVFCNKDKERTYLFLIFNQVGSDPQDSVNPPTIIHSEQSYKGKVKTHKYINRQNQSTTGKL